MARAAFRFRARAPGTQLQRRPPLRTALHHRPRSLQSGARRRRRQDRRPAPILRLPHSSVCGGSAQMIKQLAREVFHRSGAIAAARWKNRRRLRILMYHRFADRPGIARQCAHIREHYTPVSLSQVADWLRCGDWPDNALSITIYDGYRDFYHVAYPVFREYGIPATVYLVSDFLDGRQWLWVDRVRWSYLHSPKPLGPREERLAEARTAIEAIKLRPDAERLAWLDALPSELGVSPPEQAPPEYAAMS